MAQQMKMDTLGIEPRASRMLSGCDTTTPCALELTTVKKRFRKQTNRRNMPIHKHEIYTYVFAQEMKVSRRYGLVAMTSA